MSRITKKPLIIPTGVELSIHGSEMKVKGPKGAVQMHLSEVVNVKKEDGKVVLTLDEKAEDANMVAGTTKALINNMIVGVTKGFERKLILVGVGFKAQLQGKILNLILGFSHAVKFTIPSGITIEIPSQTEIIIKGIDKHLVGHVAAKIRAFRPPEPYKGKGVKYDDEIIVKKEGKKK